MTSSIFSTKKCLLNQSPAYIDRSFEILVILRRFSLAAKDTKV